MRAFDYSQMRLISNIMRVITATLGFIGGFMLFENGFLGIVLIAISAIMVVCRLKIDEIAEGVNSYRGMR